MPITPGGLAKWRIGCAATRATTEVEGCRRHVVSTPTAISLNRLLYEVKICSTAPATDGVHALQLVAIDPYYC